MATACRSGARGRDNVYLDVRVPCRKGSDGTLHLPALVAVQGAHRELVTFCLIAAQGGCGPQLRGHAADNLSVGNPYELLVRVVSSNLPFIGYPRTLNALAALDVAASPARH